MENSCKHPVVFLKDITFNQTRALLDYMYHGEVSVEEEELPALLDFAKALKVKGLVKDEENGGAGTIVPAGKKSSKPVTSSTNNGGKVNGGSNNGKVWPVNTSKLMSPKTRQEEEEPGTLVIDEESNDMSYEMGYIEDTPPAPGMVKTIGPNGKVEWKRYKQYTKDDILAAIEDVKSGMSALQASRKWGVPSRTLYDKVKKMGIMTANMQKQLEQKGKKDRGSNSENNTPSKSDSTDFTGNINMSNPISLLGMQLPQSGLPNLPTVPYGEGKPNGDPQAPSQPFTSPFMLSMIEKIKAAGLNKPPLGDAPLNLSAMLDNNGHNDNNDESDNANSGSVSPDNEGEAVPVIKQENGAPEPDNIRAQFFADLKRLKNNDTSGNLLDPPASNNEDPDKSPSQHSVTLQIREDEDVLPPRKRKIDVMGNGGDDSGDCKKVAHDDDLESSIKLEATSY